MSLEQAIQFVPAFVLVSFRMTGMMMAAPFFGSSRVPQRVKIMLALVLSLGAVGGISPLPRLPDSSWQLAVGIAGELLFGLAIGTCMTLTFVAVHWAGDVIGQQLGFGMGAMFDPQFGQGGAVVSDLYFMLTLVIFLIVGGHRMFLRGVLDTFSSLPLLSVGMSQGLLNLVLDLLQSATMLTLSIAAPVLVTMLITEVVLGFISKTIPQVNVMTAGLSLRALVGMLVLVAGAALTSQVIRDSMLDALEELTGAMSHGT